MIVMQRTEKLFWLDTSNLVIVIEIILDNNDFRNLKSPYLLYKNTNQINHMRTKLFFAIMLFSCYAFSQKIDHFDLTVNYTQQPRIPLPKEVGKYNSNIILTYKDAVLADIQKYEEGVIAEKERAREDQKNYENKSVGQKLGGALLGEKVPGGPNIGKKPFFSKIYNTEELKPYIKIPGLEPSTDGTGINITLTLDGFNYSSIIDEKVSGYGGPYFIKVINCKHSMSLKINTPSGESIYDQLIPDLDKYVTKKTAENTHKTQESLDAYWVKNDVDFLTKLDDEVTKANLSKVTQFIEDNFGTVKKSMTFEFATVVPKKLNYDDYKQASDLIVNGLTLYGDLSQREQAIADIKQAIDLWETALKESNPADKKARIDEDITAETRLNCAMAYIWINDFTKAKLHLSKIKLLDIRRYNRKAENLLPFVEDLEKRYNANKES